MFFFCCRQIEKLTDQRVQQRINSGKRMEEVRQEGEKKISQMQQQLEEEQAKAKQREDEIAELRKYVCILRKYVLTKPCTLTESMCLIKRAIRLGRWDVHNEQPQECKVQNIGQEVNRECNSQGLSSPADY